MSRTTDARDKALATAERLFRAQGYSATGLSQIIDESGAPRGSFYFHFPGGKRQLALEVIRAYAAATTAGFRALADQTSGSPDKFVRGLAKAIAGEMQASDWTMGCAAQTLAQELVPSDPEVTAEIAALIERWTLVLAEALSPACSSKADARQKAIALIAAIQGVRMLVRIQRSPKAIDAVVAQFMQTIAFKP